MVKVIAFDFGGVLGPDADDWTKTYKGILELTGLTDARMQELFNLHWPKLKIAKESMKNFWQDVSFNSAMKVAPDTLRKFYNDRLFINQKFLPLIEKLKGNFQTIIIANDSDDDYKTKIKKLKLDKVFDKLYCSSQLRISKPDKEFFEYVLDDLKIKPHEMLFIDNQENNIGTAKALGIKTILFTDYAHAVAQIEKSSNQGIGYSD